ncbi:MAG: hypothetical protein ABI397_01985 [Candidatus Saccharimonas sp.]
MTDHELSSNDPGQLDPGLFDVPRMPRWFIEPGEGEHPRLPWSPTMLRPYAEGMQGYRASARETFMRLISEPPEGLRGEGLERLVAFDFNIGAEHRETKTSESFLAWETNHPKELAAIRANSELKWLLGEGLTGHGTPGGLLKLLLNAPSLESLDLQVLSMPYSYRLQHMKAMQEQMFGALEELGADVYEAPEHIEGHPARISPDPSRQIGVLEPGKGVLVTIKQSIAHIPELAKPGAETEAKLGSGITVAVRQSWLIRTSVASGFSQEYAKAIWEQPYRGHRFEDLPEELAEYVLGRLDLDTAAVLLSVMTYAYRPDLKL